MSMTIAEARKIAANPYRKPTPTLEQAREVLAQSPEETDDYLSQDVDEELSRREDVETPYDTPSLDLPTYGA